MEGGGSGEGEEGVVKVRREEGVVKMRRWRE